MDSSARRSVLRLGLPPALILLGLGLGLLSAQAQHAAPPRESARRYESPPGAQQAGTEQCLVCHDDQRKKLLPVHASCESCHGPGSVHAGDPTAENIAYPRDTNCLSCHQYASEKLLTWKWSEHGKTGVVCMDCHSVHEQSFRRADVRFRFLDSKSATCLQCHTDRVGQFRMTSHHPLFEGAMNCIDCHNPHQDARLASRTRNELCLSCHQEQRGPWVFEHEPVAEDCMACHNPHGSASRKLLRRSEPQLCLTCHSTADNRHTNTASTGRPGTTFNRAFFSRCSDCHRALHGSHQDEWLRR